MESTATLTRRHDLHVLGDAPVTLLFVHGLGAAQAEWRLVAPRLAQRWRVVLMDWVGCGHSDRAAWDAERYASLEAHADDLAEVAERFRGGRTVLVSHSVGGMIGLLAEMRHPHLFDAHAMMVPSACYIDAPGYRGGFQREEVDRLLALMEGEPRDWAHAVARAMVGDTPPFTEELAGYFLQADPRALRAFARATLLVDLRESLPRLVKPVLLMQADRDPIAPLTVGHFMRSLLPDCQLQVLRNQGHFPQWTAPDECIRAIEQFCTGLGLDPAT